MTEPGRRQRRGALIALLLYAGVGFCSYLPLSLHPGDRVGYVGDSLESVYILAWEVHQAFRDPLHLFDANILYPHAPSLTFTDHQLLQSISMAPVLWLTGNPILATNLAVYLAGLFLAMVGRRLALALGADAVGAWAAGALYAFHTYQVNEAPRLQIVVHGFLALALLEFVRLMRSGDRAAAWRTSLFMLLQALCSNYHLLYGCVLLGILALAFLAFRPRPSLRRLLVLVPPAALAALIYLPVGLPYVLSSETFGYGRQLPVGIDLDHYLSTAPTNYLYGPIGAEVKLQQQGPHFVGFLSLALAVLALLHWARGGSREETDGVLPARAWVPGAALLALLLVALSLGKEAVVFGHDLGPGPYRILYHLVPGFHLMRIPERLGLLAMLFVGLLVARGITLVRRRGFLLAGLLLAAAVPLEHLSAVPMTDPLPVADRVPEVYRWLARHPVHALAEVPIHGEGLVRKESLEMYFSTYHFKPMIEGYASYPTQLSRLLRRTAAQFPSETALQVFRRVGVDTVVVHYGRQEGWDLYHQLQGPARKARFPELLARAGLDTFEQLPGAVSAGAIERLARFEGPGAHVFEGQVDEVYRVLPGPVQAPAPFPRGHRLRDPGWRYHASDGTETAPSAGDGDLETSWRDPSPLRGDEVFVVEFDRPTAVGGVVIPLRWNTVLPTRFGVEGRADERWFLLARFGRSHVLQLLDRLLRDPGHAALGFAFPKRAVTGIRLSVEAGGTSFDGWSLPELEIRAP